jgi:hypothetical protein
MLARVLVWSLLAPASISVGHAGTCAADIAAMQSRIDARLEARAAAGGTAPESTNAKMRRQPTPDSIAAAEVKLGELPAKTLAAIRQSMTRARAADGAGNESACKDALAAVERALSP